MNVADKVSFTAVALALALSCSQADVETEQKWLSFRCPDGQTVTAQFQPQDQFVNVRFAGRELRLPHVISGSGARYSDGRNNLLEPRQERAYASRRQNRGARLHAAVRAAGFFSCGSHSLRNLE